MAHDYLTLGGTPAEESCAQVGSENYHRDARKECNVFIRQLIRHFPEVPSGASFTVKSFPHDFGSYLEVAIVFDDESEAAVKYACKVDRELPTLWDAEARKELNLD